LLHIQISQPADHYIKTDLSRVFFPPFSIAVAPIPHPTLRGVFLPPPMYAPAAPALGLVSTVTGKNATLVQNDVNNITL
jgi:hypothetical protein